jgi:hypothetical protein
MVDLDIDITFEPGGSAEVLQRAASKPESFDLYEQWSDSLQVLWRSNAIQGVEIERLKYWHEINSLTKTGRLTPDTLPGAGEGPAKLLYGQPDQSVDSKHSEQISFLPYVHNADSFGYNTRTIARRVAFDTESWGMLLDPEWAGHVGLVNAPGIGIFDAALAAQAQGLMTFVVYAAPQEGYRAWHGVMCLSSKTEGHEKDAPYKFMNWWLSGRTGAFVARQGYYISNPERSRESPSDGERNFRHDGKAASQPLRGTNGKVSVRRGEVRNSGGYTNRFSHIGYGTQLWTSMNIRYRYGMSFCWPDCVVENEVPAI